MLGLLPPVTGAGLLSGAAQTLPALAPFQEAINIWKFPEDIKKTPRSRIFMAYPFWLLGNFNDVVLRPFSPQTIDEARLFEQELLSHTRPLTGHNIIIERTLLTIKRVKDSFKQGADSSR